MKVSSQDNGVACMRADAARRPVEFRRALSGEIREWPAACEGLYGYEASRAIARNAHDLLESGPAAVLERGDVDVRDHGYWEGILKQRGAAGQDLVVLARWRMTDRDMSTRDPEVTEELTNLTPYLNDVAAAGGASASRLRLVEAELETAQAEGVRFSRAISHGLAAPLTSTRWLLEALPERLGATLSAENGKLIETALKNLDEMTGLIEALSSHQRVGQKSLHSERATSSRKAVDAAMAKLRRQIVGSEAEISLGELPPVMVDPAALACLFENLLSNALTFQPDGQTPRVSISASEKDGRWLFRVEDNGIGIDPQHAERIFQPLQRLNSKYPGRGIGLATCRKIVERTAGRIWMEPAPSGGSLFWFTLPREGEGSGGEGGPAGPENDRVFG
jgi:signal transduction histidine kinase